MLQANGAVSTTRYMTYSYYGKTPQLNVYDKQTSLANNPGGATANPSKAVVYDQSENTVRFHFGTTNPATNSIAANSKIRVMGKYFMNSPAKPGQKINGKNAANVVIVAAIIGKAIFFEAAE